MQTFVGFGFGPIQAGLFLTEAFRSGNFGRLVVAEVLPEVVAAVRRAGAFTVNIGYRDRIEALTVAPLEIYQPQVATERDALVAAVAAADAVATAVPSVDAYTQGGAASIAAILAAGLCAKVAGCGPLAVIYAAENHTEAAALLEAAVLERIPAAEQAAVRRRVQFLDTVIGKMSGVPDRGADLAPIAPGLERAFLVEAFNRILVSRLRRPGDAKTTSTQRREGEEVQRGTAAPGQDTESRWELDPGWADYRPGIELFDAKADLRHFAAAKLYGHNAGHALAGYLAQLLGYARMDELTARPDVIDFVRRAMIEESGVALCRRYAGIDPLFTADGFRAYAEDLIERMVNPFVRDTVARVGRDPARKIGWDDRLVGAMRLALAEGVSPRRYAWGAAAALKVLGISPAATPVFLADLWLGAKPAPADQARVLAVIDTAQTELASWIAHSCLPLPNPPLVGEGTVAGQ